MCFTWSQCTTKAKNKQLLAKFSLTFCFPRDKVAEEVDGHCFVAWQVGLDLYGQKGITLGFAAVLGCHQGGVNLHRSTFFNHGVSKKI